MTTNCVTDLLIDRQQPAALLAPVLHHGQMLGGNIHEDADESARLRAWLPLAEIFISIDIYDYSLHRFTQNGIGHLSQRH